MNMNYPTDKQPTLRIVAPYTDITSAGSVFGGWLLSQLDIAGAIAAAVRAQGPIATVAVQSVQFLHPLFPDDYVSFYTDVTKSGKTSVTVAIDVYAHKAIYGKPDNVEPYRHELVKVADAVFVYVAVNKPGEKRLIPLQNDD